MEMLRIPAPPYKEEQRAAWVRDRFAELGLQQVQIDAEGNVLGELPGEVRNGPVTMLSAHLDTVFPDEMLPEPRLEEGRVYAPGAADNVAGLTGLLAVAAAAQKLGNGSGPASSAANRPAARSSAWKALGRIDVLRR